MARPLVAKVNLQALYYNIALVAKKCPQSTICAVIKANAYGHGAVEVARYIQSLSIPQVGWVAVCSIDEAIELREADITLPILLLEGFFHADEIDLARQYKFSPVIHNQWQAIETSLRWKSMDPPLWLKINTGMNRLGLSEKAFDNVLQKFTNHKLPLVLMSHYSCADSIPHVTHEQYACFSSQFGGYKYPTSLGNSAAVLYHNTLVGDIVRPGIMLYGAMPDSCNASDFGLQSVMYLHSQIIAVHDICCGESVGYGNSWQAPHDCRIGIVACGYADGYPREVSADAYVSIDNTHCNLVGRVSMDMMAISLDACPQAEVGTEVELWGKNPSINQVANWQRTIAYSLLTHVNKRVRREYI